MRPIREGRDEQAELTKLCDRLDAFERENRELRNRLAALQERVR